MKVPSVNDQVRLAHDLPEQWLHRGERGTVESMWFLPAVTLEVEFRKPGEMHGTRVVLSLEQIEPEALHP